MIVDPSSSLILFLMNESNKLEREYYILWILLDYYSNQWTVVNIVLFKCVCQSIHYYY